MLSYKEVDKKMRERMAYSKIDYEYCLWEQYYDMLETAAQLAKWLEHIVNDELSDANICIGSDWEDVDCDCYYCRAWRDARQWVEGE